MVQIFMRCIYVFVFLFWAAGAWASPLDQAKQALNQGQYQAAYEQGLALATSAGLTLATEALNAQLLLGEGDHKAKRAKQAMKLAQQAGDLDENNTQSLIQYAIAYGFYGRHVSNFKAWRKKLPQKIHLAIERAADANPDEARIKALRGAWHLSLVYKGKKWDMRKRYGASIETGNQHFKAALAQAPGDILIAANYAVMLYVLDGQVDTSSVKPLLETVQNTAPRNAVERDIRTRMVEILAALDTDPKRAQILAREFIGG